MGIIWAGPGSSCGRRGGLRLAGLAALDGTRHIRIIRGVGIQAGGIMAILVLVCIAVLVVGITALVAIPVRHAEVVLSDLYWCGVRSQDMPDAFGSPRG